MAFEDLFVNCRKIFFYIKRRKNIKMIDELPPTKIEVRSTVSNLGFKVL